MHGIDLKTQMDIVYHALNDTSKGIIDVSCCGAFKRKSAEEARDLRASLMLHAVEHSKEKVLKRQGI